MKARQDYSKTDEGCETSDACTLLHEQREYADNEDAKLALSRRYPSNDVSTLKYLGFTSNDKTEHILCGAADHARSLGKTPDV